MWHGLVALLSPKHLGRGKCLYAVLLPTPYRLQKKNLNHSVDGGRAGKGVCREVVGKVEKSLAIPPVPDPSRPSNIPGPPFTLLVARPRNRPPAK